MRRLLAVAMPSLATLLLLLAFAMTLHNLQRQQMGFDDFALTDWLIGYNGEFVRRGLGGELLWRLEQLTGLSMPRAVLLLTGVVYALLTVTAIRLAWRADGWPQWLLLVSPATAFFPAFEPGAAARKEVLLLLIPALMLWRRAGRLPSRFELIVLTVCLSLILLIHEGLFFFLPLLGVFFWVFWGCPAQPWRLMAWPAAFLGLLMIAIMALNQLYPPNVSALCQQLIARGHAVPHCAEPLMTAVSWLDISVSQVWALLDGRLDWSRLLSVMAGFLLCLLPLIALRWRRDTAVAALLATALTLPLFVVAIDWGRWLHVISVLLLYCHAVAWPVQEARQMASFTTLLLVPVLLLWVSVWQLLHCCVMGAEWGALGKLYPLINGA